MWTIESTTLADAKIITLPAFQDERGTFIKTFNNPILEAAGFHFELKESYFSYSKKDVIRGMHFQLPPHQHAKIVFCPKGAILDVLVDLRKDSKTYGEFFAHELSEQNHLAFYIPEGFAHGFKALTDDAMTYYLVSSAYSQQHDTGILYSSIGMDWGTSNPILSNRDLSFPTLKDFSSPF